MMAQEELLVYDLGSLTFLDLWNEKETHSLIYQNNISFFFLTSTKIKITFVNIESSYTLFNRSIGLCCHVVEVCQVCVITSSSSSQAHFPPTLRHF